MVVVSMGFGVAGCREIGAYKHDVADIVEGHVRLEISDKN